ncbi:HAD-IA family hydrolase [Actinoplanes sp. LDG1-06]|uniref:HAD-IA family hydrolase n=1 Tax=Paractinoplanes ovalisporus TaxID=2810368 RepID=A0ABS2A3U6_9ACTN|nr:HAD-IA family hydrolase [Actinoplanes ovalisporus]MBM2614515.1 HAD-IA family hydrolase [Actinoplanes ovalisporus]
MMWRSSADCQPPARLVVAVSGTAGSGKSTLGRALATVLSAPLLDLDSVTNPLLDHLPPDALGGHWLASPHAAAIREGRYAALHAAARDIVATAGRLVLVAPFTAELRGGPEWNLLRDATGDDLQMIHLNGSDDLLAARRAHRTETRDNHRVPEPYTPPAVPVIELDAELTTDQQLMRALVALNVRSPIDTAPRRSPTDAAPHPAGATTHPADAAPQPVEAAPHPAGASPQAADAAPRPGVIAPHHADAAPNPAVSTAVAVPRPSEDTAGSQQAPAPGLFERDFDAVLFDLDGTLADSTASVLRSWRRFAEEMGVDTELVAQNHGRPARALMTLLLPPERTEEGLARILEIEIADAPTARSLPGAGEFFAAVPASRRAVVTSGSRTLATARLHAVGLSAPEVMVTADDVRVGKPDPEPFALAARRLGVDPARCLAVEDAPAGVRSARAAGCTVLAVTGTAFADELKEADLIVDGLDRLRVATTGNGIRIEVKADWAA